MTDAFRKSFRAGWGMMDFNAHMANKAFLDFAADTRMMYFEERGFPMSEFQRLGIGPVVRRDEVEYLREFKLLERVDVELLLAGISGDGSRFRLRNVFYKPDGNRAAVVTSTGGWLDLRERKLAPPPQGLLRVISDLSRADDFEELPSSVR